jgi:Divergent InlB B-repeat domain
MSGPEPTGTVAVGRYVLAVGGHAGTLIEPGAASGDSSELAAALERPAVGTAAKEAVDAVSEATSRVEQADRIFRAVADGSIDISEASGLIDAALRLLERLDREGHHKEALSLARAISGLLALALRWAELVRSLGIAAEAARRIGDHAGAAWAQHELGTLYLAADDPAAAEQRLSEAARLRRELGDREGLAATEQNLGVLCRRLRELVREGRLAPRRQGRRRLVAAVAALLLLLTGGVSGAVIASDDDPDPGTTTGEETAHLTVQAEGPGTVQSTPAGIDCPNRCERDFARRSEIVLTPDPAEGATFDAWSGACEGTEPCRLRLRSDRTVGATFRKTQQPQDTARLEVEPPANGRVTSTPAGIDCGGTCSHEFDVGQPATLSAIADAGYRLSAWGGDCSGSGPCALTMSVDHSVSATFTPERTVSVTISGDGTVTSSPAGIDCTTGTCSALFPADAGQVVLTASDGRFLRWGGDCTGTETTCTLSLDTDRHANASFDSIVE